MKPLPLILALSSVTVTAAIGYAVVSEVTEARPQASASTETRNVGDFTSIRLEGIADLYVSQGAEKRVQVDAAQDVMSHITTTVENGTLVISTKGHLYNPGLITVHVTAPNIEAITTTGTGNVTGQTPIKASDLTLNSTGTGNITLSVDASKITSEITGTGDLDLSGSTGSSSVSIDGTGNYHAQKLTCNDADIQSSGTGDVEVRANQSLKIDLTGTGNVRYTGTATKVETSVTGVGHVSKF
jgi:hypothetical protein